MNTPAQAISEHKNLSPEELVRADLPQMEAVGQPQYTIEWGRRLTDRALVIHLFPHIVGDSISPTWDPKCPMDKLLDAAIPQLFSAAQVHAGFDTGMNSFFIIVRGFEPLDLRLAMQRFMDLLVLPR